MGDSRYLSSEEVKAKVCDMALISIRLHCIGCRGNVQMVDQCRDRQCNLWRWRHGLAKLRRLKFPRKEVP